jgi:DNA damage-binding protein 1
LLSYQVLDTFGQIGPIQDFVVVDLEKQGQGQVVTCSGAFKDGSLRVIRNGIGINEQAQVELPSIKGMWSLKPNSSNPHDKYLVVTFVGETRMLAIEDEELGEAEIDGFDAEAQTLHCANMPQDRLAQVTAQGVRLVDCNTLKLVGQWDPPTAGEHITLASSAPGQVAVVVGGRKLFYLEVLGDTLTTVAEKELPHEISCVDISPVHGEKAPFIAVGTWVDISVRVLALPDLNELALDALGGEVIPRSVLLCTMEGLPKLMCALGDGHLITYALSKAGTLTERKKVSLGTQPIMLNTFHSKNATHVLAASDRPTLMYSQKKKLMYSNLNLKEATCMCSFNSESFPESLAIASEESMTIGTIDDIQKLHVRTVPLGEQPRRICHMESSGTFGLITLGTGEDAQGEETELFHFKLIDDQTFEVLHDFQMDEYEHSLQCIAASLPSDDNTHVDYFVVGTGKSLPDESEPKSGRILVFAVSEGKLELMHECAVKGAVYDLESLDGGILAAVNSKVCFYRWKTVEDGQTSLHLECDHHGHILALCLKARGDFVLVVSSPVT